MKLSDWCEKWGVSPGALNDLQQVLGGTATPPLTEASVTNRIRLAAMEKRILLWRNNLGAYQDDKGRWVRYGLANESKAINQNVKSSDLVGIKPITITTDHIGQVIGQFIAREVKPSGWKYKDKGREKAQQRFLTLVTTYGGDAAFATGEDSL